MLSCINQFVSADDRERCDRLITKDELWSALNALRNGKASGWDGLPEEFYMQNWNTVGDGLQGMVHYACATGVLSSEVNAGLVRRIPKNMSNENTSD